MTDDELAAIEALFEPAPKLDYRMAVQLDQYRDGLIKQAAPKLLAEVRRLQEWIDKLPDNAFLIHGDPLSPAPTGTIHVTPNHGGP